MVERKEYLDQLWAWKDERQIKVVTGIRRCGKSVLLEQYQQRLLANGVAPEQIISINFENLDYEPLKDYMRLYNYLKERLCVDKMTYIFWTRFKKFLHSRKWLTAFISEIMWMFISQAPMHICCQVSLQRFCQEGTQRSRCCRFLSASIWR